MTKCDFQSGLNGFYAYYKMQIIHNEIQNLYILFNKWGRVGNK